MKRHRWLVHALYAALILWNLCAFTPGVAATFHSASASMPNPDGSREAPSVLTAPESLSALGLEIAHLNVTQFVGTTIFADMEHLARVETLP